MKLDVSKQVIDYAEIGVFKMPQVAAATTGSTATCSATLGVVTVTSRNLGQGAEETLTITNTLAAAGDACFATLISATGGSAGVLSAVTGSGTIAVTVSNFSAAANTTAYTVAFLLVKAA